MAPDIGDPRHDLPCPDVNRQTMPAAGGYERRESGTVTDAGAVVSAKEVYMAVLDRPVALRAMTAQDIAPAVDLSAELAWPHRSEDWRLLFALGEGLVAERDGELVGCTLAWRYGEKHASIGLVIVRDDMRGRGLGRGMMEDMLTRLQGRSVLLNATEDGLPLYRKLGFVAIGSIVQHQGVAPSMPLAELLSGERVRPMGGADDCLAAYYSAATGIDRLALFKALVDDGAAVVLERSLEPVGFASLRRFGHGHVAAPIIAPDLNGAKVLATHCLAAKSGAFCRLDAVDGTGLGEWLEEMGVPCVGRVTTMVLGEPPKPDPRSTCFAIAGQALG